MGRRASADELRFEGAGAVWRRKMKGFGGYSPQKDSDLDLVAAPKDQAAGAKASTAASASSRFA
jgi:hypothetical protein